MPDFEQQRATAEMTRQVQHEWAKDAYARSVLAERKAYDDAVAAAKQRLAAAEVPVEFIPDDFTPPGNPKSKADQSYAAALAELDAAKSAVEALPGAPDYRDLANQLQAAIDVADRQFNAALAAGFPAS